MPIITVDAVNSAPGCSVIVPVYNSEGILRELAGRRSGRSPADGCPVAEQVSERLLRLPFYNDLSKADQQEVIQGVLEFHG